MPAASTGRFQSSTIARQSLPPEGQRHPLPGPIGRMDGRENTQLGQPFQDGASAGFLQDQIEFMPQTVT